MWVMAILLFIAGLIGIHFAMTSLGGKSDFSAIHYLLLMGLAIFVISISANIIMYKYII